MQVVHITFQAQIVDDAPFTGIYQLQLGSQIFVSGRNRVNSLQEWIHFWGLTERVGCSIGMSSNRSIRLNVQRETRIFFSRRICSLR